MGYGTESQGTRCECTAAHRDDGAVRRCRVASDNYILRQPEDYSCKESWLIAGVCSSFRALLSRTDMKGQNINADIRKQPGMA